MIDDSDVVLVALEKNPKKAIFFMKNSSSGYSTNDAILQLVDKIFDSFEKNQFSCMDSLLILY